MVLKGSMKILNMMIQLVGWKNCTLSELSTIVIESFLPKLYEKYVELNVKFTSGYKKYQESIPESLHNRPRFIVQNIDEEYRTFEQLSPLLLEHPLMTLDKNLFNSQLTKPTCHLIFFTLKLTSIRTMSTC